MSMHAIAHGGVQTPKERLHRKLILGWKSLATLGNRTCISSVIVWCSNQLSYIPSPSPPLPPPPHTHSLTKIIPGTTLCRVSRRGWVWSESSAALLMSYLKMRNMSARLCRHGRVRFRFWLAYMWFSMLSAGLVFGYLYFKSQKLH